MISPRADESTIRTSLEIQHSLRALGRKGWWHCWNTILVIMLLMGAIISLTLPTSLHMDDYASQSELSMAVRGLLGVVLIFNLYMIYQQHLLRGLRNHLETQLKIATEQRERADALYELAILDPLTGLYNRRFGEEYLKTEIARTKRTGTPLAVALLDLDEFKSINDHYGHAAGDLVLQEFAHRLRKATRGSDIAVRLGGDEFLVILSECPPDKVKLVLSRLGSFEVASDTSKIPVFCSSGWAQYLTNDSIEGLIKRADSALYAQKSTRTVPRDQFAMKEVVCN
jgi:diguanylate cyclase (GGDEF)-like protein